MWTPLLERIAVILIPVIAGYIALALRKYLKLEVCEKKLEELLEMIKEIIFKVEEEFPGKTGQEKKIITVTRATDALEPKDVSFLNKAVGSVSNAVQIAFRIAQPVLEARKLIKNLRQ